MDFSQLCTFSRTGVWRLNLLKLVHLTAYWWIYPAGRQRLYISWVLSLQSPTECVWVFSSCSLGFFSCSQKDLHTCSTFGMHFFWNITQTSKSKRDCGSELNRLLVTDIFRVVITPVHTAHRCDFQHSWTPAAPAPNATLHFYEWYRRSVMTAGQIQAAAKGSLFFSLASFVKDTL